MRKSLTKKQIIRSKTDIDNLFKAGKRYASSCFKLLVRPNGLEYSRFIVIPVRHFGNSIRRNTIRRQIKEIWRLNQDKILNGLDCAFIVYSDSDLSYSKKEEILIDLLNRSGSLRG
ncbi:MAG: ribonuclease P protein component [Sphaerochaetaceae bacterium]|nr:ribonuclease P protein component [Sphaerochaetaceae bacterium]